MAIDTIKSTAVLDGAIATADIADDAVTSAKIDSTSTGMTLADLTVDTSTLKVDATNNRVGIGLTAPEQSLHVRNSGGNSVAILGQYGTGTKASLTAAANQVELKADNGTNDIITFKTGSTERVRVQSGGGISFNGDTATANALDDYEEGSWTANLIGSTSNPSTAATSAAASYTKIGRMVYARWMIGPVNVAGASGGIRVNGLPFNNAGGHVSGNVMLYYRKSANADAINLTPYVSGNQVYFYQTRDGYADVWAEILFDLTGASTNFYMYASVVYETSS